MNAMISALLFGTVASSWRPRSLRLTALFWIGLGLMMALAFFPHASSVAVGGVVMLVGLFSGWQAPVSRKVIRKRRWNTVRFWRTMSFFLSAGMTFWQAVDQAVKAVPEVGEDIEGLAKIVGTHRSDSPAFASFRAQYPGPEGDLVATMMLYGYQNGLEADDAITQAWDMEEQLALEDALKKQSDPLLLTVLPALLLLNVLVMFVAPMALMAMKNWAVLGY